jgi:type I restriction enzyme S subunit
MSSKTKTTTSKEEAKHALVPKLRFPGFSSPWAYDSLSKVLKEDKLKNTNGRDVFSVSMEYGIVNQIELLGRSFAAADTSHYTVGRRYDVVYTKSPLKAFPFGIVKQCKFDGEVALSPLYGVFTPPNPHLGLLIEAYFESPNRSKDFLSPLCQKGAKNTLQITNTTFLSGRLPLPTQPAEQQKIAECLSSVDELIAVQARKLDALKTHKKGLMQQLFPREGETQPRLRFPEFRNAGEWEDVTLGQLARLVRGPFGGSLKKEIFVASGFAVYEQQHAIYSDFSSFRYHITAEKFHELRRFAVAAKDIIMSCSGTMGKFAIIPDGAAPGLINQALLKLTPNGSCDTRFLKAVLELPSVQEKLLSQSAGGAIQNVVSVDQIKALPLRLPSGDEQQAVVDCLSSLDAVITAETQKHEALKTHKKGLMQQLFPSPEEVEV